MEPENAGSVGTNAAQLNAADVTGGKYIVVYIHGIGNKIEAPLLKIQWDQALFGIDMGDRTRMAYWADVRYGAPLSIDQPGPTPASVPETFRPVSRETLLDETARLVPDEAQDFAQRLGERLMDQATQTERELLLEKTGDVGALSVEARILPNPLRGWFTERILKTLVPDTSAYFFHPTQRGEIRERLRSILVPGRQPYLVIGHSMGSVIAYDVLRELEATGISVPLFLTIGSPLGIAEVQDHITSPLRVPACVGRWLNIYDPLDIVALRQTLQDEFNGNQSGVGVRDVQVANAERWSDPHSSTGYLALPEVQRPVQGQVGSEFTNPVGDFLLSRDLAAELAGSSQQRHNVLIELGETVPGENLSAKRERITRELRTITQENKEACIDPLRHYVAARLTAPEVEQLLARHRGLKFDRVWKDTHKAALIDQSIHTVQVSTAQAGYGATGRQISWAVLDTGVLETHPHFALHENIQAMWDCLGTGAPQPGLDAQGQPLFMPGSNLPFGRDFNGHGTHVAGIIAGEHTLLWPPQGKKEITLRGMAPATKLHVYKVLDDQGRGQDSSIIKALDHIADLNDAAPNLVIHGVNLSLGGGFDPTVFQCGFSPICREVRRLWRQGVVVCIAAGNEGRMVLRDAQGKQRALNFDLSIGDPANLEEAIAVGSVHKQSPQLYGISFFSSRGPTADGRSKPDLVAPGGEILSCNARWDAGSAEPEYIELSGTSMACPHVSGIIAAFLSVRGEYIGYPEKVKEILLANCTDLRRDRYHQGAGVPNLVKMLANT